jgi:hypothetical protein
MLHMSRAFTIDDMRNFAGEAWGALGVRAVEQWCKFNATYFGGALRPIPLVITQTLPYGHRIGQCAYDPGATGRALTLTVPRVGGYGSYDLLADNNTLIHEMVHQLLQERGDEAAHAGEPWRREIMRLTKMITGEDIWAGRSKTMRVGKTIKRGNAPHPETGEASLTQAVIARWPHDGMGIDFGQL